MIWLEVGDRIAFYRPTYVAVARFPFRNRRTQAWNRARRRKSLRDRARNHGRDFYTVTAVTAESAIMLL